MKKLASTAHVRMLLPLVGVTLLAALILQTGTEEIASLLRLIGFNIVVIVAIFAAHEAIRAAALRLCLPRGSKIALSRLVWLQFFGEGVRTLTHTGQFVSEPARAWMLSKQGIGLSEAWGAATSEFVANTWMAALVTAFALGSLLVRHEVQGILVVVSHVLFWPMLVVALLGCAVVGGRLRAVSWLVTRIRSSRRWREHASGFGANCEELESTVLDTLSPHKATLLAILALELLAQTFLVVEKYWILESMGIANAGAVAWRAEMLTKALGTLQFVGVAEGGFALVFELLGLTSGIGLTLSLVKRARSLIISGLCLIVTPRSVRRSEPTPTTRSLERILQPES